MATHTFKLFFFFRKACVFFFGWGKRTLARLVPTRRIEWKPALSANYSISLWWRQTWWFMGCSTLILWVSYRFFLQRGPGKKEKKKEKINIVTSSLPEIYKLGWLLGQVGDSFFIFIFLHFIVLITHLQTPTLVLLEPSCYYPLKTLPNSTSKASHYYYPLLEFFLFKEK